MTSVLLKPWQQAAGWTAHGRSPSRATVEPGAVVCGHFRVDRLLDLGSICHGISGATSVVWLGHDMHTSARVVLKAYSGTPALYANEVEVHRAMLECPRLARMLAHDDERMIVVKEFIPGLVAGRAGVEMPAPNGKLHPVGVTVCHADDPRRWTELIRPHDWHTRARSLLADVLECVAFADARGFMADHALGGFACAPDVNTMGAAEPNVVIGERATVVDACNAPKQPWTRTNLIASTVTRALWFQRWNPRRTPPPLLLDEALLPSSRTMPAFLERLVEARRLCLRGIDRVLEATIAANASSPAKLYAAVRRLG